MRTVNVDLYEFLKKHETHLTAAYACGDITDIIVFTCVEFDDLKEFIQIIGVDHFSEGGADVLLHDGYITMELNDIITEGFGNYISAYKECFDESDWDEYGNMLLEFEKEE